MLRRETLTSYRLGSAWFFQTAGIVGSDRYALLRVSLIVLLHVLELAIVLGAVITLRRELYRLERVVGRTVVYTLLTLCIITLYVLLVGGLSLLFRPVSNALVAILATGIIAAEERRHLQRDLHDELGPTLASMSMQLDAARSLLSNDPAAGEMLLSDVQAQLKETVLTVRQIVHQLRPPLLDQLGLLGAARECAMRVERGTQLRISLDVPESLPPLSAALEVAAYYIVAESLTNAARHTRAQYCAVRLRAGSELQMEVADNGVGLSTGVVAGVGLRSMRERAQELGGSLQVTEAVGGGTLVRACLPLTQTRG